MRGPIIALLACSCAGATVAPLHAPSWAYELAIYVDPHPDSSFLLSGVTLEVVKELTVLLGEAGFQAGAPADPATVLVKVEQSMGVVDSYLMTATLSLGGSVLDKIEFVGEDEPCFSRLSMESSKIHCIAHALAEKIVASQKLAALHAPAPAAAQANASPPAAARLRLSGRLAVLDLRNLTKELSPDTARYFTDLVRTATLRHAPQLEVMTRENLLVLMKASGKDLEHCEGECEVDTGRRIGADAIVSGELQKIGTRYKLTLRLHETREGRLAAAAVASGATVDALDDEANKAVAQLFEAVR